MKTPYDTDVRNYSHMYDRLLKERVARGLDGSTPSNKEKELASALNKSLNLQEDFKRKSIIGAKPPKSLSPEEMYNNIESSLKSSLGREYEEPDIQRPLNRGKNSYQSSYLQDYGVVEEIPIPGDSTRRIVISKDPHTGLHNYQAVKIGSKPQAEYDKVFYDKGLNKIPRPPKIDEEVLASLKINPETGKVGFIKSSFKGSKEKAADRLLLESVKRGVSPNSSVLLPAGRVKLRKLAKEFQRIDKAEYLKKLSNFLETGKSSKLWKAAPLIGPTIGAASIAASGDLAAGTADMVVPGGVEDLGGSESFLETRQGAPMDDLSQQTRQDLINYEKQEELKRRRNLIQQRKAIQEYEASKRPITEEEKQSLERMNKNIQDAWGSRKNRIPQSVMDIGDFEVGQPKKPVELMDGIILGQPGDIPEVDPRILLSKNSAELINSARRENPEGVKPAELRMQPRQSHEQMKSGTQSMFQKRGDFAQPAKKTPSPSSGIPMPSSYLKTPEMPKEQAPSEPAPSQDMFNSFQPSQAPQEKAGVNPSSITDEQLVSLTQKYPTMFSPGTSGELESAYRKRMMFRGATPLLVGLLAGNMGDAYTIAGQGLIEEDKLLRDQQELRYKSLRDLMRTQMARKPAKEPEKKYQARTALSGRLADGMSVPEGATVNYDPATGKVFTTDGQEVLDAQITGGETPATFAKKRQKQAEIDIASGKDIVTTTGPFGQRGAMSKSQFAKGAGAKSFVSFEPPTGLKPEQRKMFSQDMTTLERMTAKDREAIDSGELALKLLEEGKTNPSAANMGRYHLARMVEVGAMTNQDVNMPLGNLSAKQWSELWAERLKTGQVPEKIMDRMISTAKIISIKRKESLAKKRKTFSRSRAQAYRMTPDELESLFNPSVDPMQGLVDNEKEITQKLKAKTSGKVPDKATEKSDVGKMSTEELKKSIEDLKKSLKQ